MVTTATAVPFIRPLSLAELLDQAIGLYRRNFLTFIGIIAIAYIPVGILQGLVAFLLTSSLQPEAISSPEALLSNTGYWLGMLGSLILWVIQLILVQGVATAALTRAIADNYTGRPVSILGAYQHIGPVFWRLIGALLASVLINLALVIWLLVPCVGWLTGLGALFFSTAVVSPFIAPVVVLEKRGGFRAYRRAWDLGRSRFWWLVGFALVLVVFAWLLVQMPVYLIQMASGLIIGAQLDFQQQTLVNTILQSVVQIISSILYLPLSLTAITVVYFDLRVRSEGLDLALQAAGEFNENVNIVSLAETSSPAQSSLVTGTDLGYFLILTLGGAALYALFGSLLMGLIMGIASSAGGL